MKMKKKGYAMGGMKKGYSKGGMKKKGFAEGGMPMGAPKMTPEMMAKAKKAAALKKKMGGRNMSAKPAMPMGGAPKPMGSPPAMPMGGAPKMPMMKKGGMTKKGFKAGGPTQKGTKDRRISQFMDDDSANYEKFKERGTSGAAEGGKQARKLLQKASADVKNVERYGKDAPKGRSFGQKTQPKQGEMKGMKAGGMTKKMKAGGGVAKKGKAKGGKSKVRGAGIAQRGVRPAQMR